MFRYKRGVKADYNRQGYIYFTSRRYRELDEAAQQKILNLCLEHGGEYYQALFEFVTTDASATALTMRHHMDKTTLYRKVRKYYENFPTQLYKHTQNARRNTPACVFRFRQSCNSATHFLSYHDSVSWRTPPAGKSTAR